jgi:GNAT superfamily N-acetyltransferase
MRGLMYAAYGVDASDPAWQAECSRFLIERLAEEDRFAAWVVGEPSPGVRLAASGIAWVERRLPGPVSDGRVGYVASMCTDPGHRRRGNGRAVLEGLLGWFGELGVQRVQLHAASMGEGLYRSMGFADPSGPALEWSAPGRSRVAWSAPAGEVSAAMES